MRVFLCYNTAIMIYDLVIIGGGPAACSGAVYAARKRLTTLLVTDDFAGQSAVSETIYNWIGTPEIGGAELAQSLEKHVMSYTKESDTLTVKKGIRVNDIKKHDTQFTIALSNGESIETKTVLIGTGSSHRKLEVPGADVFEHKGLTYCASCDGPLFSGMPVVVIGGGNAALESTLQLAAYTSHVTLLHRRDEFRADPITLEKARDLPNVTFETNTEIMEVKGDGFVSSIVFKRNTTGEVVDLPVNGIFVEIGQIPNTQFVQDLTPLNDFGKIIVDPMNQRSKIDGIWAAGDCTSGLYHQNNIAAGDAVKALEDLYIWLKKQG